MTERTHPHADATYRVIPFKDGAFAVEVSIPETYPATVSPFATEADAEAWIAEHRRRVRSESKPNRWFFVGPIVGEPTIAAVHDRRQAVTILLDA